MDTTVLLEEELKNKILLVSAISLPEPGGVSNYVDALIKTPIADKTLSFNFYNPFKSSIKGKYYLLKKIYLKSTKLSFFLRILIMVYFIKKYGKGKIIYAMDASISGLSALLSFKQYIVRWVGDFSYESSNTRKIFANTLEEYLKTKKDWKYYVQKMVLKKASLIIVPSKYLKKILINYYGIKESKIKVINNFANITLQKNKRCKNKTSIVFIGRLVALKQPHLAIKLHFWLSQYRIKTYIIGEGILKKTLKKVIEKLNIHSIYLEGYKSKKDIAKYLQKAYFVIIPSIYEGQSFTALEAVYSGIPVLIRNLKPNRELLGKDYPFYFKNDKEMIEKAKKIILDNKRISINKKILYKYSWKNHYFKLLTCFARIKRNDLT